MQPYKKCPKCEALLPSGFFALHAYKQPVCIGCRQRTRDHIKARNRWTGKASDTRRRHAPRWHYSVEELEARFGWRIDRMAHDAQHAYENQCPGCRELFKTMGHGLSDITLDISDPTREPFYVTNTRWICQTCNRQKRRMSPEQWAERLIGWSIWERHQQVGPRQRSLLDVIGG